MKKWILIVVLSLLALGAVAGVGIANQKPKTGQLNVTLQLPDTQGVVLKINDQTKAISGLQPSFALPGGNYTISVTRVGYHDFSTNFNLATGHTTTVNVVLVRTVQPTAAALQTAVLAALNLPGLAITDVSYFYANTWAVVTIHSPTTDNAYLVARFNDATGKWQIVLQPGTTFEGANLSGLPADVSNYLQNKNLVQSQGVGDE